MKRNDKKGVFCFLFAGIMLAGLLLAGCSSKKTVCKAVIHEDEKFGSATIDISQEEFFKAGFALGDSCDLVFSNGFELKDVPLFNGYYVKNGEPVVVAYPGFENVSVTYNNEGIWQKAGFKEGDSVSISVNKAGKYLTTQEALGQSYSGDIDDYPSEVAFANFRALAGGKLKKDFLFRGASPVDNKRGRAATVNALLEKYGIQFVMDLADSVDNMESFHDDADFASDYTYELYKNGKDALLGMGSAYASEKYQKSLVEGLRQMLGSDGPVYIHCLEGKDRTGFVCMLVEALAGASYDEMRDDYMITYQNYYQISKEETPEKFEAVENLYFAAFMEYLHGSEDMDELKAADFSEDAKAYLLQGGMSETEIAALVEWLAG